MALLSIFVDLSRSTLTKVKINHICKQNEELKQKLLKQYHRILVRIERDFYYQCEHNSISLEELFLVKSIGDEYWYVHYLGDKTNELHKRELVSKYLNIWQYLADRSFSLFISEREVEWEEEKDNPSVWKNVNHERVSFAPKVTIDFIDDYINFASERQEEINEQIKSLINEKQKSQSECQQEYEDRICSLAASLNLGTASIIGNKIRFEGIRFDQIGVDVDLFFRICHFAVPGIVQIGYKLFEWYATWSSNKSRKELLNLTYSISSRIFPYIRRRLCPKKLKGVGKPYEVYYLPYKHSNRIYHRDFHKFTYTSHDEARRVLLKHRYLKRNLFKNFISIIHKRYALYQYRKNFWR